MKRLLLLLIILMTLLLSSCGRSVIDENLTPEEMKQLFPELFPMSEEECGHLALFYKVLDGDYTDLPSDKYHYEYCAYPNCGHKYSAVPHSETWRWGNRSKSFIAEDGNYYHRIEFFCTGCGKRVVKLIRCSKGVENCTEYSDLPDNTFNITHTMEEWEQIALGNMSIYN